MTGSVFNAHLARLLSITKDVKLLADSHVLSTIAAVGQDLCSPMLAASGRSLRHTDDHVAASHMQWKLSGCEAAWNSVLKFSLTRKGKAGSVLVGEAIEPEPSSRWQGATRLGPQACRWAGSAQSPLMLQVVPGIVGSSGPADVPGVQAPVLTAHEVRAHICTISWRPISPPADER